MGIISFLTKIFDEGYESLDEYCNLNGCNICDVVDDPDDDEEVTGW
jgi:hypothetical protein